MEREKWVQDSSSKQDSEIISEDAEEDSQFFNLASKAIKKIQKKELQKQTSREDKSSSKINHLFKSPKSKSLPLQSLVGYDHSLPFHIRFNFLFFFRPATQEAPFCPEIPKP